MNKLVMSAVGVGVLLGAVSASMVVSGQGKDTIETLRARISRLEAKEEVLSTFNQYLYGIDTGFKDDILTAFCENAVLDVPNFPGAKGDDLHFEGREKLAPLYANYSARPPRVAGGHHSANIAVNVHPDLKKADLSSYFMTSGQSGVQGGRYEGVMRREGPGKWCFETLVITSAWGFRAKEFETISKPVTTKYSPRGGHHAAYKPVP